MGLWKHRITSSPNRRSLQLVSSIQARACPKHVDHERQGHEGRRWLAYGCISDRARIAGHVRAWCVTPFCGHSAHWSKSCTAFCCGGWRFKYVINFLIHYLVISFLFVLYCDDQSLTSWTLPSRLYLQLRPPKTADWPIRCKKPRLNCGIPGRPKVES